ncbi:polcalcin Jun o 2-like [Impatiens glandulifera]|uniref:polcalcin Jun o 2-like n=1 Tax=Impatiens glandulifera TaxID=253017 RepID=UPI001FB1761B|nr:polcalcin Jun o 2-like [Impatiens glandulifera]
MAIASNNKTISHDGRREMTVEEFKAWLIKKFDCDRDGRISKDELRQAVRLAGGWFAGRKVRAGVQAADANCDGYVEEEELDLLVDFAQKHLKVKIVPF